MYLPVLKKNNNWRDELLKFREEVEEVFEATTKENLEEELLDVIQMCIGMLNKSTKGNNYELEKAVKAHNQKLRSRDWEMEKIIEIKIFKFEER